MSKKISAVRRIQFCAGHRVDKHESKCATLHGHNYVVFFHAESEHLDSVGRIIDFSVLKELLGGWIDENWDHTTILFDQDLKTIELVKQAPHFKDVFLMPTNPTAENMASYLLKEVCPKLLLGSGVTVTKVVVWETENCFAEASLQ